MALVSRRSAKRSPDSAAFGCTIVAEYAEVENYFGTHEGRFAAAKARGLYMVSGDLQYASDRARNHVYIGRELAVGNEHRAVTPGATNRTAALIRCAIRRLRFQGKPHAALS